MSPDTLSIVLPLALLLVLLLCETPVALSLGASGALGIWLQDGGRSLMGTLGAIPYSTTSVYTLTLIPMFILLGLFFSHSGMLAGTFDLAQRLTRRLPGGLGIATVAACTFFGGISGSSVADAATLGRLSIGEMSRRGYEKAYAAAVVAASGTVAILIPPSIVIVIYGILTGESIGRLLLAGVIPGFMTAASFAILVVIFALRRSDRGGREKREGQIGDGGERSIDAATPAYTTDVRTRWFGAVGGILVFAIVVGGLYAGVFTATEAGAMGALAAFIAAVAYLFSGSSKEKIRGATSAIGGALQEAAGLTAMIFALLVGASLFSHFLVLADIPFTLSDWVVSMDVNPALVVALFLLLMIPLGMLVDGLSMLLIVTPIAYPVVTDLGYDGIWFGILMIKLIEIGLLTPPVGLNIFVVSGLFKDLRVETVFLRVAPFVVVDLCLCAALFTFPQIVTFLPDLASPKL